MKLSEQQVEHVAELARLELSKKEKEKFKEQLSSILDYVEKLNRLNTAKTEPTANITGLENVIREDKAQKSEEKKRKRILDNAPNKKDNYLKVKAILE